MWNSKTAVSYTHLDVYKRQSKYNGQDFNQGFSVNGTVKKVNYLASINSSESDGMSQIAALENQTNENDRFSRVNYMSKIGFKASEKLTLDFFGNFDVLKNDYDCLLYTSRCV